jgi:leucyl aminopeptidase
LEFPFDRTPFFTPAEGSAALPIWPVGKGDPDGWNVPEPARRLAKAVGFSGESGAFLAVPGDDGDGVIGGLFGLGTKDHEQPLVFGRLPSRITLEGPWTIDAATPDRELAAIGLALGGYRFDRYKSSAKKQPARFVLPDGVDADDVERQLAGSFLARDLINMPANDLGPVALEAAFRALAGRYGAHASSIVGDELLAQNFPMIHAVGRASAEAPRLLEMKWGQSGHPKVTLVGKGVCFDTGGLDIKPASGMLLMKKDMGGAANVLGLALMIMDAELKVDLRVLVPAVENSISANAFRPGDILRSRAGLTVEIANTDAEGRLVLADALSLADAEEPDLLIDMATLTGAARVALGPDLPPYYSDDETLAAENRRKRGPRRTIPPGACRSTWAMTAIFRARSRTSTMPRPEGSPARSPRRSSSSGSSSSRGAGPISTSMAGRRRKRLMHPSAARPNASARSTGF